MLRAGGSTLTVRLITAVRVSQRGVTCAWVGAHTRTAPGADSNRIGGVAGRGAVKALHWRAAFLRGPGRHFHAQGRRQGCLP